MIALRHIAIKEGVIPPFIKMAATNLVNYGQSVKPDPEIERVRKELELEDMPSRSPEFSKVVREINLLIRSTGYDKLIGIESEVKI